MRVFARTAAASLLLGAAVWLMGDGLVALAGGTVALLSLLGLATAALYLVIEPDSDARTPRRTLAKTRPAQVTYLANRRCNECNRLLVARNGIEACVVCDHLSEAGSG